MGEEERAGVSVTRGGDVFARRSFTPGDDLADSDDVTRFAPVLDQRAFVPLFRFQRRTKDGADSIGVFRDVFRPEVRWEKGRVGIG